MLNKKMLNSNFLSFCFIIVNAAILVSYSLLKIFNVNNSIYTLIPITGFAFLIIISAIFLKICEIKYAKNRIAHIMSLSYITIILVITLHNVVIPDYSWDGQAYHLPSILTLMADWNPYWDAPTQLLWTNVYPHGYWLLYGLYGTLLENIEYGKIINIFFLTSAILIYKPSIDTSTIKTILKNIIIFTVVLSNIFSQYITSYLDVSLYILFLIAFITIFLSDYRLASRQCTIMIASLIIIMVNTKTSGLFFGFLILILYWSQLLIQEKSFKRSVLYISSLGSIILFIGVILVGWRPWITNIREYNALTYPDPKETLLTMAPQNLREETIVKNIAYSLFGVYGNIHIEETAKLKPLFSIDTPEFETDPISPRSGGFGPLFGSILLVAVGLRLASRVLYKVTFNNQDGAALFIFIACYIMPGAWWARFYPIIFLIPILLTVRALDAEKNLAYLGAVSIVILLSINFIPTVNFHTTLRAYARAVNHILEETQQRGEGITVVKMIENGDTNTNEHRVWAYRLSRWKIPYNITTDMSQCSKKLLVLVNVTLCKNS